MAEGFIVRRGGQTQSGPMIAFGAYRSGDTSSVPSLTTIVMDMVDYNYGNGYNPSTGRFTAPVKGIYEMNINLGWQDTGRIAVRVRRNQDNENNIFRGYRNIDNASFLNHEMAFHCLLEEGDVVDFVQDNSTRNLYSSTSVLRYMCYFSGSLVYEVD